VPLVRKNDMGVIKTILLGLLTLIIAAAFVFVIWFLFCTTAGNITIVAICVLAILWVIGWAVKQELPHA